MTKIFLRRISEDPDILAKILHQEEGPTAVVPDEAMVKVVEAVQGMLYADHAGVVSTLAKHRAQKHCEVVAEVFEAFGLTVF